MKKSIQYILFSIMIGVAGINTSCKKDDEEILTLKGSGNYKMNVVNETTPVAGAKAVLYKANSNSPLKTLNTDNSGNLDFGSLIEGDYTAVIEVSAPKYAKITQVFQVVSGQNNESKVQVKDHVGTLIFALVSQSDWNTQLKEDIGMGIALLPINDDYNKAKTNEEKYAISTAVKYFGEEGKISFQDVPTGEYYIYKAYNGKIIERFENHSTFSVSRGSSGFRKLSVNLSFEKIMHKASWEVLTSIRTSDNHEFEGYPIESIQFTKDDPNYPAFKFMLTNGAEISGRGYFYSQTSEWSEVWLMEVKTSKKFNSSLSSSFYYKFNDNGELQIRLNSLHLTDALSGTTSFYTGSTHILTLK